MRRLAIRASLAAAAVALMGPAGPAYLVIRTDSGAEIKWNLAASAPDVVGGKVTFYIDRSNAPGITGDQFAAAVRAAVQSWEDVPASAIAFEEETNRPSTKKNASDRINRFGFTPDVLGSFTFGAAFTLATGSRITDVDVVFNPDMDWAVQTPGDPGKADVQSIATHEWGHGIGLDHVPLGRSTMYYIASPGQLSSRTLEIDDRAAAAHLYPGPSLATDYATLGGHVAVAGSADARGIQVTAIEFVTGFPAASSFTDPSGLYEIQGLPPGIYRVVASPIGKDRVANQVYSSWWDTARTDVLPAVLGVGGASDGTTGAVILAAGQVLGGIDLSVAASPLPDEPNDTRGSATPTALGRSIAARIEDQNDLDFYSFSGTAGHTVSIFVHSRQIGSDLNPRVYLRDSNGIPLAIDDDISTAYYEVDGADVDSRILDFVLPATATYFVEIEPAESPDSTRPEDYFYVLTLLEGGTGTPNPATSAMTASPAIVPADGASVSTIEFRPRTLQATEVGPGRDVAFELVADGDPDGTLTGVTDKGDGTYVASITAPSSGGSDVVRALMDGMPVTTVVVTWRGDADAAASGFSQSPRRIRYDGAATAVLAFVPRDANGIPFGPGHSVGLLAQGTPAAGIGPATDAGDGSYTAVLKAGTAEETPAVIATVDAKAVAGTYEAEVGFPLGTVVDGSVAELDGELAAVPPPPAKAVPKLAKARGLLAAAAALSPETETLDVLSAVQRALKQVEAAAKKGSPGTALARDLGEAAREAARKALDAAGPLADTGAEQKALAQGEAVFGQGGALLDGAQWSKAAAKFRSALVLARKVR
jgi:hypothetical protein